MVLGPLALVFRGVFYSRSHPLFLFVVVGCSIDSLASAQHNLAKPNMFSLLLSVGLVREHLSIRVAKGRKGKEKKTTCGLEESEGGNIIEPKRIQCRIGEPLRSFVSRGIACFLICFFKGMCERGKRKRS